MFLRLLIMLVLVLPCSCKDGWNSDVRPQWSKLMHAVVTGTVDAKLLRDNRIPGMSMPSLSTLKLPGAAAPAPAAPGTGKRLSLKLPTRPAEPGVEAAPMDVEPPAAPRTGKRLSLKLPARLADQPPPPPSPPPPSSNAMSDD